MDRFAGNDSFDANRSVYKKKIGSQPHPPPVRSLQVIHQKSHISVKTYSIKIPNRSKTQTINLGLSLFEKVSWSLGCSCLL